LKELASAGLVESRRDGQFVYYRTLPDVLEAYMGELRRRVGESVSVGSPAPKRKQAVAKRS
jgi:DNA-binding transcriptional ArsR family regulator